MEYYKNSIMMSLKDQMMALNWSGMEIRVILLWGWKAFFNNSPGIIIIMFIIFQFNYFDFDFFCHTTYQCHQIPPISALTSTLMQRDIDGTCFLLSNWSSFVRVIRPDQSPVFVLSFKKMMF